MYKDSYKTKKQKCCLISTDSTAMWHIDWFLFNSRNSATMRSRLVFIWVITLRSSWLVYSSVGKFSVDAIIYYSLVMEYCHFLIVEKFTSGGLFDLLQTRTVPGFCIRPMRLPGDYRECGLCQDHLAFNCSTQLIKLWVDTQAWLINYYFVLKTRVVLAD